MTDTLKLRTGPGLHPAFGSCGQVMATLVFVAPVGDFR